MKYLLDTNTCLQFSRYGSSSHAEAYAQVPADLAARGTPIGPNDLRTAAIASVKNLTLITPNTVEFGWVAGPPLDDWQV